MVSQACFISIESACLVSHDVSQPFSCLPFCNISRVQKRNITKAPEWCLVEESFGMSCGCFESWTWPREMGGGINNTLELEDERGSEVIMWYLGDINI